MRILFWFFYASTVVLWFKDSFPQLKFIPINYRMALAGFIAVSLIRLFLYFKKSHTKLRIKFGKNILLLAVILIVALSVRIPYLMNHAGLSDSDDGLTMLMSKHIAEGKLPPLYFYKQYYQGSLFSHFSALLVSLFGYSHLLIEIAILFFFLGFIAIQFYFLEKIFSLPFAAIASFFYCLPIGHLVKCSFFVSSAYPLVLLMGSAILFLAYLIVYSGRTNLLPALGFLIGLTFWAHQISIIFILTAALLLLAKIQTLWKKYLHTIIYVLMGGLPLIMGEIFWNFHLIRYLLPGGGKSFGGASIKRSFEMSLRIFSQSSSVGNYAFFLLLVLGFFSLLYPSIKAKKLLPLSLFSLFFLLFAAIYFISRFGEKNVIRYFYILYFCLPVLLFGFFRAIRTRLKYLVMGATVLLLFFGLNLKGFLNEIQAVKIDHRQRTQTIEAMKETGQHYWRGNFWAAYLLTALSGEEAIVDSFSVNRYYPYRLFYENQGASENFVFMTDEKNRKKMLPQRFPKLLDSCQIAYKKKQLEGFELVYDIPTAVSPAALIAPFRSAFPDIAISDMKYEKGFLDLTFTNIGEKGGSGYWIHAEIPGFSSGIKGFPAAKGFVRMKLPIPRQESFPLEFYLIYKGIEVAQSHKKIVCSAPMESAERKNRIVFLSGVGPKVKTGDREMFPCALKSVIEINGELKDFRSIRLWFYSPFEFSDPAWYGDYLQELDIQLNGSNTYHVFLNDGDNVITIPIEELSSGRTQTQKTLSLLFKYHLFFGFSPFQKTAALLEKIELER